MLQAGSDHLREAPGVNPSGFAKALEEYATVLRKTNRAAEAEKVEARARAIREGQGQAGHAGHHGQP